MRKMKYSLGFAIEGIVHAFRYERNLRFFLYGYIFVIILGIIVRLLTWEWLALIVAGSIFFSIELVNTALERLTDVIDQNRTIEGTRGFHAGLKAAKDVAASASLVCLVANAFVIVMVFWPYVAMRV